MKKILLLSVVASTMIMAGGDIAPVEPVVEAPVAEASGWDFSGQAVAYYQTQDHWDNDDLFDNENTKGNLGIQLRATNSDLAYGIGAGVEVSGLTELPFDLAEPYAQRANGQNSAGWISQAYLTYGFGNTSIKVGRQELPMGLSPFAFSESWNVFKNTFDAALVVNTDITDTTLVYAFVRGANDSFQGNMRIFNDINEDGVHMLTAQNKSFDALTLTGSWYYAPDMAADTEAINILWADAKFAISGVDVALQGGTVTSDLTGFDDTNAYGAQAGYDFGMFNAALAYSSVNDGAADVANLATEEKSPLYTQMLENEEMIFWDSKTVVVKAGAEALGGNFEAAYGWSDVDGEDASEFDFSYSTTVGSTQIFAAYINQEWDNDTNQIVRVWGRYNF